MDKKEIQKAVKILEEAILELLKQKGELSNTEIAKILDLQTSHESAQKNYLTYSILGELMKNGVIQKTKYSNRIVKYKIKRYFNNQYKQKNPASSST